MKLNFFKFQDGKVFWLPEYPEKEPPAYEFINPEDDLRRRYDKAIAHSLASAIEVAPEDADVVKIQIWWRNIWTHGLDKQHANQNTFNQIIELWQPEKDKVYSAECEIETKYQLRNMANNGWIKVSRSHYKFAISDESFKDGKDYRQVACLNPKYEKAGRPENYPWPAKEPEKAAGKWRVESSTSPIADTGDYFTQLWLTNGIVNLHSEKDDNETELQAIADQLNQNKPA